MTTKTKKFVIPFSKKVARKTTASTFFKLARKNIVKGKKKIDKNLSRNIDKIVYG